MSQARPADAILGGSGLIDGYLAYPVGTRSPLIVYELMRSIQELQPMALVYLAPFRSTFAVYRDLAFFRLCGIRRVIGLPYTSDLRHNRVDPTTGFLEQECARLARNLAALGQVDLDDRQAWDLRLTREEDAVGRRTVVPFEDRRFIAINMGGKAQEKDWGATRWQELVARISAARPDVGLLILGGPEDIARAEAVSAHFPLRVVNACGALTPRESFAAVRFAGLFIGHDSGPLHLAAAAQVTCIGLFTSLNPPRIWHPYGSRHRIIHSMRGMSAISVDEVFDTVVELLPARAEPQ